MGRGWLGIGILVLFLALGMVISSAADNAHLETAQLLAQAAEKAVGEEFEAGTALGLQAKARWERHWDLTASIADHSPMDEVDALFAEMEIYARTGEEPHFAACCKELSLRIEAVADAHRFSWWNIL